MSTLERAIEIAASAHAGTVDKAGQPYVLHPLRIMLRMPSATTRIAAVLHDVVEDTPWTLEQLAEEGFSEIILAAVEALTIRPGEDYMDFVRRAASNPDARAVKIADVEDNMDLSRIAEPTEKDLARIERYREALGYLKAVRSD